MPIHKVRIDDVYVLDFYHNPMSSVSVCIQGTLVDSAGYEKTKNIDGKVELQYDSSNFTFPDGSDVIKEMHKLKDAFLKHKGRVVNLDCP